MIVWQRRSSYRASTTVIGFFLGWLTTTVALFGIT